MVFAGLIYYIILYCGEKVKMERTEAGFAANRTLQQAEPTDLKVFNLSLCRGQQKLVLLPCIKSSWQQNPLMLPPPSRAT